MHAYRITIALVLLIGVSLPADAQRLSVEPARRVEATQPIAQALRAAAEVQPRTERRAAVLQRPFSSERKRGPGRIIAGAAVGATAGFFGGGYLGSAIDGDCGGCDDPGLKGALIGAPVGAVVGGILGGKFLF
jgi:hypothetical protein